MPIAIIKIIEGRSLEKKRRLIESVSRAMADSLEMPIDGVRVLVDEYPPHRWGRGGRQVSETLLAAVQGEASTQRSQRHTPHFSLTEGNV